MANGTVGNDTPGSILVLSGLRKMWLWAPLVSVGGYVVWILTAAAGAVGFGIFVLIVTGLVGLVIEISGLVEFFRGATILLPLVERSAQASIRHASESSERPAVSAGGGIVSNIGRVESDEAEVAAKEAAEREIAREERRKRFDGVDPLVALLSDPELAAKARDLRMFYGIRVCASFLTTTASALGMGDIEFKPEDIPDDF